MLISALISPIPKEHTKNMEAPLTLTFRSQELLSPSLYPHDSLSTDSSPWHSQLSLRQFQELRVIVPALSLCLSLCAYFCLSLSLFLSVSVCVCVCVCGHICTHEFRCQGRALDPLKLKLQMVVVCHVGAGTEPELSRAQWVPLPWRRLYHPSLILYFCILRINPEHPASTCTS